MSLENELKIRFGGFWNSLVILLVLIICLRFSSIQLTGEPLWSSIACSFYLFLVCIGVGFITAILKVILGYFNDTASRLTKAANFTLGLKYGFVSAGMLVFIVGVFHLDDFIGPFQLIVDAVFANFLAWAT